MNQVIRAVAAANRIVLWTLFLVIGLIACLAAAGWFTHRVAFFIYLPVVYGTLLTWLTGLISGTAAAVLHLSGRWDGFWHSAAPPVLGMVSFYFAMAAMPPPPVAGALVSAALGALCLLARPHRDTPERRWGTLPLFALPFLNVLPPLAFWAPITAAVLFVGIRLWLLRPGKPFNPALHSS